MSRSTVASRLDASDIRAPSAPTAMPNGPEQRRSAGASKARHRGRCWPDALRPMSSGSTGRSRSSAISSRRPGALVSAKPMTSGSSASVKNSGLGVVGPAPRRHDAGSSTPSRPCTRTAPALHSARCWRCNSFPRHRQHILGWVPRLDWLLARVRRRVSRSWPAVAAGAPLLEALVDVDGAAVDEDAAGFDRRGARRPRAPRRRAAAPHRFRVWPTCSSVSRVPNTSAKKRRIAPGRWPLLSTSAPGIVAWPAVTLTTAGRFLLLRFSGAPSPPGRTRRRLPPG